MYNKITEEQKNRLVCLLEEINGIFTEEENEFTEDEENTYDWINSKLYKGIEDAMYELNQWC